MLGSRVAVFGGSGFIGRYLIRRLAQAGANVTVAVRDPEAASFLKPMGDVGQVTPIYANVRKPKTVARALEDADAVVNLTGVLHQGDQTFAGVHAIGAKNIAAAAAEKGISRFIQMSAIGADPKSGSAYSATKAAGEAAVREAVPGSTILRPSVVFGPEDDFLNRFGAMVRLAPFLPLIGGGHTKFQPVYVADIADAIMAALQQDSAQGATYELGGPRKMTFREVMEFILVAVERRALLVPVPAGVAMPLGLMMQILPNPPLTMDQVRLLESDNVVADDAMTFADLGVTELSTMEAIAPAYLSRFRKPGRQITAGTA
jgi:uncharacterized protein YbjT (DUF2867 family)